MLGKARRDEMLEKAAQDGGTKPRGHPDDAEETGDACTATGGAPLATAGAKTGTDGAQLGTGDVRAKRKSDDAEMGTNAMALIWQLVTGH